jgi:hypothetical protein
VAKLNSLRNANFLGQLLEGKRFGGNPLRPISGSGQRVPNLNETLTRDDFLLPKNRYQLAWSMSFGLDMKHSIFLLFPVFTRPHTWTWGSWGSRRSTGTPRKTLWCWTEPRWPWTSRGSESPPESGARWPEGSTWNTRPGSQGPEFEILDLNSAVCIGYLCRSDSKAT